MLFLILLLNFSELDFFPVGGCVISDDRVYLTDVKGHQAVTLNLNLVVLSRSDGTPHPFSHPMRVLKGPGKHIGIFNMGTHAILTFQPDMQPIGALRVGAIPVSQSARRPEIVAFLDDDRIWQTRLWTPEGFPEPLRSGGKPGRRNRRLGNFFQDHLVIPFGNGKVLWADSLDKEIFLDSKSLLRLDFEEIEKLPGNAQAFQKVIPYLYRFYQPGCFAFLHSATEKAVVTIAHPLNSDDSYTVYVIDEFGAIEHAGIGEWFPLGYGEAGWLVFNGEEIRWTTTLKGL